MREPRDPHSLGAALRRQAVLTLALLALAVIVPIGVLHSAPLAGRLLAALLLVLAAARAFLPVRVVGALAVRSRGLDVAFLLLLSIAIGVLSTSPNL
ncbi:DUF3017 domain-containing protein [Brachybacterium aquaticum]|uniref:DUF3017 domain-containing protein n=1 Tax=Brachybacterium aquaticum TaxID=1432564 RepID=A0A841AB62_9MICO|nr:DUF3017 domain-containing protein [Brachybacterium aquaticum]MBB5830605.1 hypothetical protein [Brachybacterium aquaticum]